TFLPAKPSAHPLLPINEIGGIGFDVAYQISQGHCGLESNENMNMVRHSVNGDQLLFVVPDDTSNVLVKFFLELWADKRKPTVNCEHSLNVDLRVGVCHESF